MLLSSSSLIINAFCSWGKTVTAPATKIRAKADKTIMGFLSNFHHDIFTVQANKGEGLANFGINVELRFCSRHPLSPN